MQSKVDELWTFRIEKGMNGNTFIIIHEDGGQEYYDEKGRLIAIHDNYKSIESKFSDDDYLVEEQEKRDDGLGCQRSFYYETDHNGRKTLSRIEIQYFECTQEDERGEDIDDPIIVEYPTHLQPPLL